MPRKALALARAALWFAQETADGYGAAQRCRRGMRPLATAGGRCFSAARAALTIRRTRPRDQLGSESRTKDHPTTYRYDCSCNRGAQFQPPACRSRSAWMLILRCPRCENEHEDVFDVLDADALECLRCENCRTLFWFAVMECHRCAHEEAFAWPSPLSESDLSLLVCWACRRLFRYHEDSSDQEFATRT